MAANWEAIEDVLQAFVARASGLAGSRCVWADQNGRRAQVPFIELRLDGGHTPGPFDEERVRDNPTPSPGAEILIETVAQSEITLVLQAFTAETTGNSCARALLTRVKNAISKGSELERLDAAGIGVIDRGTVQNLTALLETENEGRAALDVRLRVSDGTEDTATYIETVDTETTFVP